MKDKPQMAPAIVMSLSETGLSVARALGRRGIQVAVVSPRRSITAFSRFVTYIKAPQFNNEDEKLLFYLRLGEKLKPRAVLIPILDSNVMFISRNRKILKNCFYYFLPSDDLLKSITSKLGLIDISAKNNIPLPPSIRLNNQSNLKKIPSSFFPCVLKPESQDLWWTQKAKKVGIGGVKALPVGNKHEFLTQYTRLRKVDSNLILQKMIVGPDENHIDYHALIDSGGRIIAEFVGKKRRLTPPHFGMGCYVESVKSAKVIKEGRRILRNLDYTGMANINFKKDERDSRLYFFELNPRFSFWTGLDVACGVDFPYYYYKLCLGEKVTPKKDYIIGKTWLSLYHDIRGIRTLFMDGSITWRQWVKSIVKADVRALYAPDDPLPAIMFPFDILKRLNRKLVEAIRNQVL